jgi:Fe-S-cluster-containing hydrogenase component 2
MTLEEEFESGNSLNQLGDFFKKGAGKERGRKSLPMLQSAAAPGPFDMHQPLDAFGEIRKKLAIKCDLCAGYDNQACVQACPTGAAIRVQPTTFFGSTEDILRRRAH